MRRSIGLVAIRPPKLMVLAVAALGVVCCLAGCASSRVAVLPGRHSAFAAGSEVPHEIAVGDEAEVVMIDGRTCRGHVVSISPATLVLGRSSNYGYDQDSIDVDSIESISWVNSGKLWPYLAVIVVGAVAWTADQLSHFD